jgi:hypothetical protein
MKKSITWGLVIVGGLILGLGLTSSVQAKSSIKSYYHSSGTQVRSYTRYKADGYKFNNYQYRPDRGYKR